MDGDKYCWERRIELAVAALFTAISIDETFSRVLLCCIAFRGFMKVSYEMILDDGMDVKYDVDYLHEL